MQPAILYLVNLFCTHPRASLHSEVSFVFVDLAFYLGDFQLSGTWEQYISGGFKGQRSALALTQRKHCSGLKSLLDIYLLACDTSVRPHLFFVPAMNCHDVINIEGQLEIISWHYLWRWKKRERGKVERKCVCLKGLYMDFKVEINWQSRNYRSESFSTLCRNVNSDTNTLWVLSSIIIT